MSKHTPGPWEARLHEERDHKGQKRFEVYAPSGAVTGWGCVRQTEANAHLIAAAPEMYEALNRAYCFIAQTEAYKVGHVGASELVSDIHAAIAKAEGRQ